MVTHFLKADGLKYLKHIPHLHCSSIFHKICRKFVLTLQLCLGCTDATVQSRDTAWRQLFFLQPNKGVTSRRGNNEVQPLPTHSIPTGTEEDIHGSFSRSLCSTPVK